MLNNHIVFIKVRSHLIAFSLFTLILPLPGFSQMLSEEISLKIAQVLAVKILSPDGKKYRIIVKQIEQNLASLDGVSENSIDRDCIEKISQLRIEEKNPANLEIRFIGDLNSSTLDQTSGRYAYGYRIAKIIKCE